MIQCQLSDCKEYVRLSKIPIVSIKIGLDCTSLGFYFDMFWLKLLIIINILISSQWICLQLHNRFFVRQSKQLVATLATLGQSLSIFMGGVPDFDISLCSPILCNHCRGTCTGKEVSPSPTGNHFVGTLGAHARWWVKVGEAPFLGSKDSSLCLLVDHVPPKQSPTQGRSVSPYT